MKALTSGSGIMFFGVGRFCTIIVARLLARESATYACPGAKHLPNVAATLSRVIPWDLWIVMAHLYQESASIGFEVDALTYPPISGI